MSSPAASDPQRGPPFESARGILRKRKVASPIATGSPELDRLTGRLVPGLFYLLYGDDDTGVPDVMLHRLLVEAVAQGGRAVYVVCGNYRRSRTVMDSEFLLALMDEAGLDLDHALDHVHLVFAFSERHLMRVPSLVKGLLEENSGVTLVAVQQLPKLFYGADALRFENPAEFTGIVSRLKAACSERQIALVATCRQTNHGRPIPLPEGGAFLRHAANAILYFRESGKGPVSAYIVKHPDRARMGNVVHFGGGGTLWDG